MLDDRDLSRIKSLGIAPEEVEQQLLRFRQGFPPARLVRPATTGDGIFAFGREEADRYAGYFEARMGGRTIQKFVPASGAATRMFRDLFEYRENRNESVEFLVSHLEEIAFYDALASNLSGRGSDLPLLLKTRRIQEILDAILLPEGLNYAALPKGLLLFHNYPEGARTAAEEHLVEAAEYAADASRTTRIHFTVSPEHREKFRELTERVIPVYEQRFGVRFEVSFSTQKPSTDTIAVDDHDEPFRNTDGTILFRPGGHGSLLHNLNDLEAEIIFVKNIDNVVPDRLKNDTYRYKKIIGGVLLEAMEQVHGFLQHAAGSLLPATELAQMAAYTINRLKVQLPGNFNALPPDEKQKTLVDLLDRPIRVCGMVKNEGEPGGGPFWVEGPDGVHSLQIIESSQADLADPQQKEILARATHFNPVDLVCSIRDFSGKRFDLQRFLDESTGFISSKTSGGRKLKALERPGLWNGAMAGWITVFVEVPVSTFNPVKTVNDLLRPEHLPA